MKKQTYKATLRFPDSVNEGLIQIIDDGETVIGKFTLDYLIGYMKNGYLYFDYYIDNLIGSFRYYGRFEVRIKEFEIGVNYIFATKDEYDSFFTIDEIVNDEETIKYLEKHIKIQGR